MKKKTTTTATPSGLVATKTVLTLSAILALGGATARADIFGSGADQFTIDFVSIGNPGNPADTTGLPNPAGAVSYKYKMGTYEVSEDMITKAIAGGLRGVWLDTTRGPNKPATWVDRDEAAKFVNWLNTNTGHQPAYNLDRSGYLTLWSSAEAWQKDGENLYRHKDAYYALPSENEWYKAAYYSGTGTLYHDYPTGSDTAPKAVAGGTEPGTAVFDQLKAAEPADINDAGGLSPYGTMGQGGNVYEWMETAADGTNDRPDEDAVSRGGLYYEPAITLASTHRDVGGAGAQGGYLGFRVAVVPEPAAGVAVAVGLGGWMLLLRRRRRSSR